MLLQSLTKRMADSPLSTCSTGGEAALSWRVSMLVMAGIWSVFTCCFVIFFNTKYRRLLAEAQPADPGSQAGARDETPNLERDVLVDNLKDATLKDWPKETDDTCGIWTVRLPGSGDC